MPAAYAHHTFGAACLETLPPKIKAICTKYRELFDIGVHGPDVLFYYNPLSSNKINSFGQELHHWTGAQFFEVAKYSFQENDDKQPMLAYLLGFLAHFTLDSSCHDYVNEETEDSGLSHNLIESQYEVFLMEKDGKDPMEVDRSLPLKASSENASIIARFFPFEEEEIRKAMKGQKTVLHLFYSPAEKKKKLVRGAIAKLKIKGDFSDLFLDREHLEECERMKEVLCLRQKAATELYPKLAKNLTLYLYDKGELDEYFTYDFEGELH